MLFQQHPFIWAELNSTAPHNGRDNLLASNLANQCCACHLSALCTLDWGGRCRLHLLILLIIGSCSCSSTKASRLTCHSCGSFCLGSALWSSSCSSCGVLHQAVALHFLVHLSTHTHVHFPRGAKTWLILQTHVWRGGRRHVHDTWRLWFLFWPYQLTQQASFTVQGHLPTGTG